MVIHLTQHGWRSSINESHPHPEAYQANELHRQLILGAQSEEGTFEIIRNFR